MTRSRGQILLIAALGIAVAVLALAVVTNTALYADTLAARDSPDGQDALAFQASMEAGTGDLLDLANRNNASGYDALMERFDADVSALADGAATQGALDGTVKTVHVVDVTNGSRIAQNTTGEFTDTADDPDWTLANDVDDVRRFELVVDRSSLNDTGEPNPFTVTLDDGERTWRGEIAAAGTDSIQLTVSDGDTTETCSGSGPAATIDLTEGQLNGTDCAGPTIASTVTGPYSISVENGDAAAGTFQVYVDQSHSTISKGSYGPVGGDDPFVTHALFDATIETEYEGPSVTYTDNSTVAPTEPPPGAV